MVKTIRFAASETSDESANGDGRREMSKEKDPEQKAAQRAAS